MRVALALDEEASSPAGLSWTLTGMTSPESGAICLLYDLIRADI